MTKTGNESSSEAFLFQATARPLTFRGALCQTAGGLPQHRSVEPTLAACVLPDVALAFILRADVGDVADQRTQDEAHYRPAVLPYLTEAINTFAALAGAVPRKDACCAQQAQHQGTEKHGEEALHHRECPVVHAERTEKSHHV
eukprot:TRINITY_DN80200_c0_g1_i1.p1 TRINITY_DN80200_c0_g1~~TRINITY_DN80200_c0_g1_i1.p1  ORF type:complete len:143 (+),score=25.71 TRINITY_DN80200_c0_g1_i1:99-527(+)